MQKILIIFSLLLFIFAVSSSCKRKASDDPWVTKRIVYDVNIKSPDPSMDWWIQNIEGESRERLIRDILQAVYAGKVKAWNFDHTLMHVDEVKAIGNRIDTLTFQRPEPPYDLYDTIVKQELNIREITRLRFLEIWKMNPESLHFTKEVAGVCPMLASYDPEGNLRGYMPMFWVYFDPAYPAALQVATP